MSKYSILTFLLFFCCVSTLNYGSKKSSLDQCEQSCEFEVDSSATYLQKAVAYNAYQAVERLLAEGQSPNTWFFLSPSPLMIAAINKNQKMFDLLLSKGADVNSSGFDGKSCLYTAVGDNYPEDVIAFLLKQESVNVNQVVGFGRYPLLTEVKNGNTKIVNLLISQKADVNICGVDDQRPLHVVPNLEIAKLLIENGACFDVYNFNGQTPLSRLQAYLNYCSSDSDWQKLYDYLLSAYQKQQVEVNKKL